MLHSIMPDNLESIFTDDCHYNLFQSQDEPGMDNIEALSWFIAEVRISDDHIRDGEDTKIILSHPSYEYFISIDSSGLGDDRSHLFEVTKLPFCEECGGEGETMKMVCYGDSPIEKIEVCEKCEGDGFVVEENVCEE